MRVVSLCPSLTELVFDLGRGDDLVGITKYCIHPADRVGAIEKVGGTKDPAIDRIVELAPDVVLLNREENRIEDARALERAGVHCHVSMPRTVEETAAMVRSIGDELQETEAGEAIARDIEGRSARVRASARGKRRVRWAYLIWRKPLMTVNRDTFVDALLEQAGGTNVFGDHPDRYPTITAEDLASKDPEVVFLGTEPFHFQERHAAALAEETGLPPKRFRLADGEYLSWHGSRTPDGIDYAAQLLSDVRG